MLSIRSLLSKSKLPSSRFLATSAAKRKVIREGGNVKSRGGGRGKEPVTSQIKRTGDAVETRAVEIRQNGVNWKPIFFLGVFPIVASGIVVLSREDLRQELEEKGLGRAIADMSGWRKRQAEEAERQKNEEAKEDTIQVGS
jgi:hypothetical protein